MTRVPDDDDLIIGKAVAYYRRRAILTQKDLTKAMNESGWITWHAPTVVAVEQGIRPLRLTEAATLTELLDCSIDQLLAGPPQVGRGRWRR